MCCEDRSLHCLLYSVTALLEGGKMCCVALRCVSWYPNHFEEPDTILNWEFVVFFCKGQAHGLTFTNGCG